MNYAVITDNGGGKDAVWHDVAGEEYSFPEEYMNYLEPGTQVIYHRAKKRADSPLIVDRLSDESHYFGVALVGDVSKTPDGNYRAEIRDFCKFKYPVDIHRPSGEYYEINPFFQRGVRPTDKTVYDDIVAASKLPPTPAKPKVVKRKGIKSLASLSVIQRSKKFNDDKYEVVTSSSGYYIYNVADALYYLLECPASFDAKAPNLRILASPGGCYLILHDGKKIGVINIIDNGVLYDSQVTKDFSTSVYM